MAFGRVHKGYLTQVTTGRIYSYDLSESGATGIEDKIRMSKWVGNAKGPLPPTIKSFMIGTSGQPKMTLDQSRGTTTFTLYNNSNPVRGIEFYKDGPLGISTPKTNTHQWSWIIDWTKANRDV